MRDSALFLILALFALAAVLWRFRRTFSKQPVCNDSMGYQPTPVRALSGQGHPDELILGNLDDPLVRIMRSAIPNGSAFVQDRLAHAVREVHETSQILETGRVAFFDRIEGLKKRDGNFFAFGGIFDDDHQEPVSEEYRQALGRAIETATMVENQAQTATRFSADFDRMMEGGIAIDVRIDKAGKVEVLAAGPA